MAVVVDTSLLIDYLAGSPAPDVARAAAEGRLVVPPLVVAEVVTGAHTAANQEAIFELLQDTPTHPTDLLHWLEVGRLRRHLAAKGINVTIPDGHIAQCALELNAVLLTRDAVFTKIATQVPLRLRE